MKTTLLSGAMLLSIYGNAQLTFTISSATGFSITCNHPAPTMTASSSYSNPVNYSWAGPAAFLQTAPNVSVSNAGTYTVTATSGLQTSTQTVAIGLNTTAPISSASSTFAVTSGSNTPSFTFTAISPTVNIVQIVYSPLGSSVTSNLQTMLYQSNSAGTYTHCIIDLVNGCSSCQNFQIALPGSPGGDVGINESLTQPGLVVTGGEGWLKLTSNETGNFNIINMQGALARRIRINNEELQIYLLPGIYYLVGDDASQRPTKVLVW